MWLMQNGMTNFDNAGAASHDFLNLFGITALTYMWALQAKAALRREEERRRGRSVLRYEACDGPLLPRARAAGCRRAPREAEERRGAGDGARGGRVLMAVHTATVTWKRGEQPFADGKYSRAHEISFDGGVSIPGSSSPSTW